MKGLEWGRLYQEYHSKAFDPKKLSERVHQLLDDPYVHNQRGIWEYLLSGEKHPNLLNVRVFDEPIKRQVYNTQTKEAQLAGRSNCPLCAVGHSANDDKIWKLTEMEADHVSAWSKGGATSADNCQMLCKTHNRAKGNN
jgi:5-methylcytosine-specific restriction endonuclease McrA